MKELIPSPWLTITLAPSTSMPWNYTCGFCRTIFMGIAETRSRTDEYGRKHQEYCQPAPYVARPA